MSYDVWIECSHCHQELEECFNYTYNISSMLHDVGIKLNELDSIPAKCIESNYLTPGILLLEANPEKYRAMNPKNGFGNYDSLLTWLKNIRDQCLKYPDSNFRVS